MKTLKSAFVLSLIAAGATSSYVSFAATETSPAIASSVSDKEITSRVRMVLANHPGVGVEYTVSTRGGVVYLDGVFATGLMKSTAEELAMDVTGVKQVIDLAGISK
jgi:osmotically-inducible protein OsmY